MMEFTGFRPEGLDLLIENRMRNSKEFYEMHKPEIKALIQEPFYALIERMESEMCQIDPLFVIQPRRMLSRVRRDTRFSQDKSLYRDHAWITFGRMKGEFSSRPSYYFEITPQSWGYGCGYYQAPPNEMQMAREMMITEDKLFVEAFQAVRRQKEFVLYGDTYKRIKYPNAPTAYQPWLQRKNLGVSRTQYDFEPLFDGSFVEETLKDMKKLAPLYRFMCAVKERVQIAKAEEKR